MTNKGKKQVAHGQECQMDSISSELNMQLTDTNISHANSSQPEHRAEAHTYARSRGALALGRGLFFSRFFSLGCIAVFARVHCICAMRVCVCCCRASVCVCVWLCSCLRVCFFIVRCGRRGLLWLRGVCWCGFGFGAVSWVIVHALHRYAFQLLPKLCAFSAFERAFQLGAGVLAANAQRKHFFDTRCRKRVFFLPKQKISACMR